MPNSQKSQTHKTNTNAHTKICLPDHTASQMLWSVISSFIGIYLIAISNKLFNLAVTDHLFLIGSFGASAVLIFGTPRIAYAQPRNLIGGHLISAIVGVTVYLFIPLDIAITSALAVSLSIMIMQVTGTIHPPGGATALIAVIGSQSIHDLGYWYVVTPVAIGIILLFIVAFIVNNLSKDPMRKYPKIWF